MRVYILLYNVGTENEGIHTLETPDSKVILMFESEDDAIRYGLLLEAQDFLSPSVEAIDSEEIEEFCRDSGYDCKIVEVGMLEIPPEKNIDQTEWNPENNYASQPNSEDSTSEMSPSELELMRRKFENLL